MKVAQNRLKRVFILFREYISYLVVNPRLIFVIPKRLWEEFSLHIQYFFVRITGTSKNQALRLQLQTLRTDMESADLMYRPSLLWEDLYSQFERVLHVEDMSNFKTQRYNRRFSAYSPHNPIFYEMTVWLYWQHVRNIDTLKLLRTLEEPQLGNPDIYRINGKSISFDLLQSLDEFYGIHPYIEKKKNHPIIAELGAGYGRLGYVLLHALPKSTYIVVDLPGSLIIAQYYLSRLLSSEKILTYEQSRNIKQFDRTLLSKYTIIFLAPWQLPNIKDKSLDMFINIYSFQEMTKPHINNYFSLIDKKCAGYFYSKQSYDSANPKDDIHITISDYPNKKKWRKIYERNSAVRQDVFEALYRTRK